MAGSCRELWEAISLPHRLMFGGIDRSASKLGVLGSRD